MRWLVPETPPPGTDSSGAPLSTDDLVAAYGWPENDWVRGVMVMALDGSFTGPDGLSGTISSDTDGAVFNGIRRFADAYLVGARTVRLERYTAVRAKPELAEARAAAGLAPVATLAIVSATSRFDWEVARFIGSDVRPVILTVERSDPADRATAQRWCDVAVVGESVVEPAAAIAELRSRGLTRVACEGGDALLSEMIRGDALDELDLTISPLLTASPRDARVIPGVRTEMDLHQLVEHEGFLYARYLRRS